ncbi:hypothetical protein [Pseudomonas fluorescens]|uniref:hypothetical protein n=1 Tax=Pseudomonas fluorescens TaxID=294 RepID=UPI001F0720A0|nr:hypothetical protein [Pseudomonas fluorescens]
MQQHCIAQAHGVEPMSCQRGVIVLGVETDAGTVLLQAAEMRFEQFIKDAFQQVTERRQLFQLRPHGLRIQNLRLLDGRGVFIKYIAIDDAEGHRYVVGIEQPLALRQGQERQQTGLVIGIVQSSLKLLFQVGAVTVFFQAVEHGVEDPGFIDGRLAKNERTR